MRDEAVFLAVALLLAYGIYQTAGIALGTGVPVVAVTSPSMEPVLQRGDMIVVQGRPFDRIEESDIVVFQPMYDGESCKSIPIIHRVTEKQGDRLATKGDANTRQIRACYTGSECFIPNERNPCPSYAKKVNVEQNITADQVKGVAAATIPWIGHVKLVPACLYQMARGGGDSTICPF